MLQFLFGSPPVIVVLQYRISTRLALRQLISFTCERIRFATNRSCSHFHQLRNVFILLVVAVVAALARERHQSRCALTATPAAADEVRNPDALEIMSMTDRGHSRLHL